MDKHFKVPLYSMFIFTLCMIFLLPTGSRLKSGGSLEEKILENTGSAKSKVELYQALYAKTGEHNVLCLRAIVHQIEKEFKASNQNTPDSMLYMADFGQNFPDRLFLKSSKLDKHQMMYFIEWAVEKGDQHSIKYLQNMILTPSFSPDKKAIAAYALLGGGYGGLEIRNFVETAIQFRTDPRGYVVNEEAAYIVACATAKMTDRKAINPLREALKSKPVIDWKSMNDDAFSGLAYFDDQSIHSELESYVKKNPSTALFRQARLVYKSDNAKMKELFGQMGTGMADVDINLQLFSEFLACNGTNYDLEMLVNKLGTTEGMERLLVSHTIKRIIQD